MKLEIMTLAVRIAFAILMGILAPAAKKWLSTKTENEKLNRVKGLAKTCVQAAEQLHKKVRRDDPDGEKRFEYAYEAVEALASRLGLSLTEREIEAMIEAAVQELNASTMPFDLYGEESDGTENH